MLWAGEKVSELLSEKIGVPSEELLLNERQLRRRE